MALCVAAYGFLVSERSPIPPSDDKTFVIKTPGLSKGFDPAHPPDPSRTPPQVVNHKYPHQVGPQHRPATAPMPLLPKSTVILGMFSALHEPSEFGLREALRILFGLKAEDGLVVIDGHNDSVRYCPCRVLPRCYFYAEGHPLSRALRQACHGHGGRGSLVKPAQNSN
jgi:hypothetical protein